MTTKSHHSNMEQYILEHQINFDEQYKTLKNQTKYCYKKNDEDVKILCKMIAKFMKTTEKYESIIELENFELTNKLSTEKLKNKLYFNFLTKLLTK